MPVKTLTAPLGSTRIVLRLPRAEAADLDIGRHPDPDDLAVGAGLLLLLAEFAVAGYFERLVERLLVLAGVVGEASGGRIRKGVRLDEVLAAQLGRVHSHLVGEDIDGPFDIISGFRTACPAVGADRLRVGVDGAGPEVDVGDRVAAGRHHRRDRRHVKAHRVGPCIADHVQSQAGDRAVLGRGQLDLRQLAAAVVGGDEVLRARFDPADRPPQLLRDRRRQQVLTVDADLGAEAAADLGRDDADHRLRHAELGGQVTPRPVRSLGRLPDGEPAGQRIGRDEGGAPLHRQRDDALRADPLLDRVRRLVERLVGVAACARVLDADVVRDAVPDSRRARLAAGLDIGDGLQLLIVDLDQFGGVASLCLRFGEDRDDRLSGPAHLAERQRPLRRCWWRSRRLNRVDRPDRLAGDALLTRGRDQVVLAHRRTLTTATARQRRAEGSVVLLSVDRDHARCGLGGRGVDALDPGVRIWRAQQDEVCHPGQLQVAGIDRRAGDQSRIFLAANACPNHRAANHPALPP